MNKNNLKFKDLDPDRKMLIKDDDDSIYWVLRFKPTLFHKHPRVVLGQLSYCFPGRIFKSVYSQENFDLEKWKLVHMEKED